MQNGEHFLKSMRSLDETIEEGDYEAAISFALSQVPMIDDNKFFGEIGDLGVYFADSRESRWFPNMTCEKVANILAKEML